MPETYEYALALVLTFLTVFVKIFQQKNVIGSHLRSAVLTSFSMAFLDYFIINLMAKSHWTIAIAIGLGASGGLCVAIKAHDRLFKRVEQHV